MNSKLNHLFLTFNPDKLYFIIKLTSLPQSLVSSSTSTSNTLCLFTQSSSSYDFSYTKITLMWFFWQRLENIVDSRKIDLLQQNYCMQAAQHFCFICCTQFIWKVNSKRIACSTPIYTWATNKLHHTSDQWIVSGRPRKILTQLHQ